MLDMEELVHQYGSYIYHVALSITSQQDIAEEITQLTLIKAMHNIKTLQNLNAIKAWLRKVCLNEYRMILRKESKFVYVEDIEILEQEGKLLVDVVPSIESEIVVKEEVEKLRNGCFLAMARKLTVYQRIAFSLVDMFGVPIKEVANILEVSPQAVKGLLYRARLNLESFFHCHCHLLDIDNACTCESWLDFYRNKNTNHKKIKQYFKEKEYLNKEYTYCKNTRKQILAYYQKIPTAIPPDSWYQQVIKIIQKN